MYAYYFCNLIYIEIEFSKSIAINFKLLILANSGWVGEFD